MQSEQIHDIYEFGAFRLNAEERRLTHSGEGVGLTPKEFELLTFLVRNAGRVVKKEDLLENVWPETFVEEATLTRNISWLRGKLANASGESSNVIETVPKFGYRFLPAVTRSNEEVFVVDEVTVRHVSIDEIIEFDESTDQNEQSVIPGLPAKTANSRFLQVVIIFILVAVAGFVAWLFLRRANEPMVAKSIVPFSGLPGRESNPSFSPDGKQVVFVWDGGNENGSSDIYLKLIGAGDPLRLTTTAESESHPVFSPDGLSIAFVRSFTDHHEILTISALGGSERRIREKASFASLSYSPDGRFLVAADLERRETNAGIYQIDLQTGETKKITNPAAPFVDHTPRFAPDGKTIAFIRYFDSLHREVFLVAADGGEPVQLTSDNVRIYGLAWHPDGKSLFFTSFRTSNRLNLWQLYLPDGTPRIISTGSRELGTVAVSPDGRTVAFVEEITDENIWDISPGQPSKPIVRSSRSDHSPQISPDATKLVFASDRTGSYEIWISDVDGKNQHQISKMGRSSGSPRFSPDGRFVVYDAQISDSSDIYVVPVNGGESRRITDNGKHNYLPAFSRDGTFIFFVSSASGSDEIWKVPFSGGRPTQLTTKGGFEMFAHPDGKSIVYSKGAGKAGLWSVGIDGAGEGPVEEFRAVGGSRAWTLTDNALYYVAANSEAPYRLMRFDLVKRTAFDAGEILHPPLLYYSNLAVSGNGQRILYARQDQSASTIMFASLDN